jgi:hypothetical protein
MSTSRHVVRAARSVGAKESTMRQSEKREARS